MNLPPSAGIIGWPVAHSKSPLIHRFWLAKLGLDGDYGRFPVPPEKLGDAIRALPSFGLRGVNVTVPHKVRVIDHLDAVDLAASSAGAVNTVAVHEDGLLTGHNTDIDGILSAVPESALNGATRICLIGSGGAARAALAAFRVRGADQVTIVARNEAKAGLLMESLGYARATAAIDSGDAAWGADLIVNATSLGMAGQPELPAALLECVAGRPSGAVFDMVYAPLDTALLRAGRHARLRIIDGLQMLTGQAAAAFELFFGGPAPREHDAELRALLTA